MAPISLLRSRVSWLRRILIASINRGKRYNRLWSKSYIMGNTGFEKQILSIVLVGRRRASIDVREDGLLRPVITYLRY